ncbi:MAG: helix-hairpin-helix domain-containing protein, partial [Coriobacteriales bacterium]|nr:helix-hairpin-helix domain-containing protein [Coriobacteriales bacterium]
GATTGNTTGGSATNTTGSSSGSGGAQGKVNINTADAATLETLPGVGPATAQKIVQYRTANGAFKSIEDLKNVSGIGEKKYAQLADSISVG